METKICTKCKEKRERTLFSPDKRSSDRLQSKCKICYKEYRDFIMKTKDLESINDYRNNSLELKKCSKCNGLKKLKMFNVAKTSKNGISTICKSCTDANFKIYSLKNREILSKKWKKYREESVEKIKIARIKYSSKPENLIKSREAAKIHYYKNRVENCIKSNNYAKNNREKINNRIREKRKNDPLFKISERIRACVCKIHKLKGIEKTTKSEIILGTSFQKAKEHIEKQFVKGMSWDNYGEWHIDHIIPLSIGKNKQELMELSNYQNLQPLWAFDNQSKQSKILLLCKLY